MIETVSSVVEIERKFILKKLPDLTPIEIISILQYYKDGFRYRMQQVYGKDPEYYKIQKIKKSPGVNQEVDVKRIDVQEFYTNRQVNDRREISKKRHVYKISDKLKAEIDVFSNLTLTMMEVEVEVLDQIIPFPKEIQDVMLLEVTGNERFDNYTLAS
jgi:CYTH domain-containing protein